MGTGSPLGGDGKALGMMVVVVAQQCARAQHQGTVRLTMVEIVSFMLRAFYHNLKKKAVEKGTWERDDHFKEACSMDIHSLRGVAAALRRWNYVINYR